MDNIQNRDGGVYMDEHDAADLRVIELALMNPRSGTAAAQALEQLSAHLNKVDAQRFPRAAHPVTGALCFCQTFCEGRACHCWCHEGELP